MGRALALVVASLLLPANALAATVRVAEPADAGRFPQPFDNPYTDRVLYEAGPGEGNRLVVAYAGDAASVTVSDPGAVIEAGESCESLDAHTARCVPRAGGGNPNLQDTEVVLGDLDDEVRTTRPTPYPIGGVVAFGGSGNDLLEGGAGSDILDGGGGRDRLLGGASSDLLMDGDRSGRRGELKPNRDVLDGGEDESTDMLSYADRTRGVIVDLLGPGTNSGSLGAGEPRERDLIRGFEDVAGGSGPDRIVTAGEEGRLLGNAGNDVLRARGGGAVFFEGGAGRDRLKGYDGDDNFVGGEGLDSLACRAGEDRVHAAVPGELLEPGCETVAFRHSNVGGDYGVEFSPHPVARSSAVVKFLIPCWVEDTQDSANPCSATAVLREASGRRRLLGRGKLDNRVTDGYIADVRPTRVSLTPLGRSLYARPEGVVATLALADFSPMPIAWTVRLAR